jgi:two-component system response regulator AtoC
MLADQRQYFRVDAADLPSEAVIFGCTAAMRRVHAKMERVIESDLPVLLEGERGTGKDMVARFLHARSSRREGPFVKLSCAAIPQRQLEAELLGCEGGPGFAANEAKPGLIELAASGTLFLDEVGEMGLTLQRKLLLLLQDGGYFRVGGHEERKASARIVCATNIHLGSEVKNGTFRRDLFDHMDMMCFRLSALRERKEDIPRLWDFFAGKLGTRFGKSAPQLTPAVLRVLEQSNWPGNLCELENCIARIMILGDEEAINEELRRQAAFANAADGHQEKNWREKSVSRQTAVEARILQLLQAGQWNRRKTTGEMKRSYRSLLYRLRSVGRLQRPRKRRRFPRPE